MQRKRLRVWDLSRPTPGFFLAAAALLFAAGLLTGFILSGRIPLPEDAAFQMNPDAPVTLIRLLRVFWSHFRWSLFGALLSMTALGLFLLFPLVFLRGLLIGFSFTALFVSGARGAVLLHFLCTTLLTCSPLLLIAACGMVRAFRELHRAGGEDGLFGLTALPLILLLAAVFLTLICSLAELWLLPGFASHIQPFT